MSRRSNERICRATANREKAREMKFGGDQRRAGAYGAAVLLVCAALLAFGCGEPADEVADDTSFDDRPVGTIQDVAKLRDREDLNVLFILVDTLRADRLSSYGYERQTSPVLDYVAATGLRFARHRAQSSWTKTSMASLWSGFYPTRTGVLTHRDAVSPAATMPAEVFRENGFFAKKPGRALHPTHPRRASPTRVRAAAGWRVSSTRHPSLVRSTSSRRSQPGRAVSARSLVPPGTRLSPWVCLGCWLMSVTVLFF